jgi:hypothetical protein
MSTEIRPLSSRQLAWTVAGIFMTIGFVGLALAPAVAAHASRTVQVVHAWFCVSLIFVAIHVVKAADDVGHPDRNI